MTAEGTLEQVRQLLREVRLRAVEFHDLHARRNEGADPIEGEHTPVSIEMDAQIAEDFVAYRFKVGLKRSDVDAGAAVVVIYDVEDTESWHNEAVLRMFGELVAMPAAYPYARTKIQDMTSEMGIPPVVLGILLPAAGVMASAETKPSSV